MDVISVKFIYKPATFEPVGPAAILDSVQDPEFIDTRNRPTLIQHWRELSSGGSFVFAINHLKSKGSGCGAGDDTTDGSGNCAGTRNRATAALVRYLATDPTNSNTSNIILMGDFNAYYNEQALQNLYSANYTNLEGPISYSYQFSGAFGSLDHGIASPTMRQQISGARAWHINADEPIAEDYNQDDGRTPRQDALLYNPGPFRSSDHDPVVVGLNLTPTAMMPTTAPTTEPTIAPTATPTAAPTAEPTAAPTDAPTAAPTLAPTAAPTEAPTVAPTAAPTAEPTAAPTITPTATPTALPTAAPTVAPTAAPTLAPTAAPTKTPTKPTKPSKKPTKKPTRKPTKKPTRKRKPTKKPTKKRKPTKKPTKKSKPTKKPTKKPKDTYFCYKGKRYVYNLRQNRYQRVPGKC
jgi:hypothetical protein